MGDLGFFKTMINNKTLHLAKLSPYTPGGIETVVKSLMGLYENEEFICFGQKEDVSYDKRVTMCRMWLSIMGQPLSFDYFFQSIQSIRASQNIILHAPNYLAMLAVILTRTKRKNLVIFWHSDIVGKGFLGRALRSLEKIVLSRSDTIICTSSEYAKASDILQVYKNKIKILPIGIKASKQVPYINDTTSEAPFYISIGRLVSYKNYAAAVQLWKSLDYPYELLIVGNGEERANIEESIKKTDANVKLLGQLTDEDKMALIQRAHGLILWSNTRAEAFGVVLIEALSVGTPIFSYYNNGSGMVEVTKNYSELNLFTDQKSLNLAIHYNENKLSLNRKKAFKLFSEKYTEQEFREGFRKILSDKFGRAT